VVSDGEYSREVIFNNGMFETGYDSLKWDIADNDLEVIGNIHENKELLEQ
jgi:hypothetical protein